MIEYIKGDLAEITPALAVIETAGVGYALNISLTTYSAIQGKEEVILTPFMALLQSKNESFIVFLSPFRALVPILLA